MNKVRIGSVGLGRLGLQHAVNIAGRIQHAELAALCDVDEIKLKETGRKLGVKQNFTSFEDLKEQAKVFSHFHNENHRYSSQGNRTPNQMVKEISYKSALTKNIDLTQKIFIEEGRLIFIRFIRSDSKLHILNEIFKINPALKYSYVVAEIILEKYVLVVSQNNKVYHIFPFAMSLP
jgi:hypothetical protein